MNTISDLRQMLADTIRAVKAGDIDTDRAKTINDLCKTVVDTAKTEVDYCRVTGAVGSGFINPDRTLEGASQLRDTRGGQTQITAAPGVIRTVHKVR